MPKELFISDVCDTLYASNTTFDFLDYFLQNKTEKYLLKLIRSKMSPLNWCAWLLTKISKRDYYRIFAVKLLKGYSKQMLEMGAHDFYFHRLKSKEITASISLLKEKMNEGAAVYLASSSLSNVIEVIGKELHIPFVASELHYNHQNICTGTLSTELTGKKLDYFKAFNKNDFHSTTVMTDNFSDYALAKWAEKRIILVYSEKNKDFWKDLSPTFIEMY